MMVFQYHLVPHLGATPSAIVLVALMAAEAGQLSGRCRNTPKDLHTQLTNQPNTESLKRCLV